ncbi:MAG: pyrimidine-nucleoside phosphorylase, partial [Desulfurobacterium sp.]
GSAVERFIRWIEYLGGAPDVKVAEKKIEVKAPISGYITHINGEQLGYLVIELGGGRRKAEDRIDYSVGLRFFKKIGDYVEEGEPIGEIYYSKGVPEKFVGKFLSAYTISEREKIDIPIIVKKKIN